MPAVKGNNLSESLNCFTVPALQELAKQLDTVAGLNRNDRMLIEQATRQNLDAVLQAKLHRLMLLELNAARVNGQLRGNDGAERWQHFLELAGDKGYWESLTLHYPKLLQRIERVVENRCRSSFLFAERFAADKAELDLLFGSPLGELSEVGFGIGDSHRGGKTVAILRCKYGRIVYKPRSLAVDARLRQFITDLQSSEPPQARCIKVPRVLERGDYGWCEFIDHRYASGHDELTEFYTGIGQWLAVMRLLGGSDLHSENLIASGPNPFIVDCETLFTPRLKPKASGKGLAYDCAAEQVMGTVLGIGLLPGRGMSLGWRGVDASGVGSLPGQQPKVPLSTIVEWGTDEARLGTIMVETKQAQNHPSQTPALADHWSDVLVGFDDLTAHLQKLDEEGDLALMLDQFSDCRIRVVPRSTEVYSQIGRMLWHPVSLHNEADAELKARELLVKMSENNPVAPGSEDAISGEIANLLEGDIPFYSMLARHGQLEGPNGARWLDPQDRIVEALNHWRGANLALEREVIRGALISAYANDDSWSQTTDPAVQCGTISGDLEERRRQQAATIMKMIVDEHIAGDDGTVSWIASVLGITGWSVQPLSNDLYSGLTGIAVVVAAYLREFDAGRANFVEGLKELLPCLLKTLRVTEDQQLTRHLKVKWVRPSALGFYVGLGAQMWTWLQLAEWGLADDGVARAAALADEILKSSSEDEYGDILTGKAGAIVPLLMLAEASSDSKYLTMAVQLGEQLDHAAVRDDRGAHWVQETLWPKGMGGFAHGAIGIAWALSRLADASGNKRFAELSFLALQFEESLFDDQTQNWKDLRTNKMSTVAAWCNGAVGIGLALGDLNQSSPNPQYVIRIEAAASAAQKLGMGRNNTICHGDLGAWELLRLAIENKIGPDGLNESQLLDSILTTLETHGPTRGLVGGAFSPGLMTGLSGMVYQLLRANPASNLPSIMLPGGALNDRKNEKRQMVASGLSD